MKEIEDSGVVVTKYEDIDIAGFKAVAEPIYDEYEPIVTTELLDLFRG